VAGRCKRPYTAEGGSRDNRVRKLTRSSALRENDRKEVKMKLLLPKGFRIELKMPNGIDGEAEGYYEEEIDKEKAIKELGNNWEEQLKEQITFLQTATGILMSFDKERNTVTFSFQGVKGKDAIDIVIGELIGNSEFARMSLADLMAITSYHLAKAKVE